MTRTSTAVVIAGALLLAGCGTSETAEAPAVETGLSLRVLTPYSDLENPGFEASVATFEKTHKVDVELVSRSGDSLETLLLDRSLRDDLDAAVVSQPGLVTTLVKEGVIPVVPTEDEDRIPGDVPPVFRERSVVEGRTDSAWIRASAGGFWYRQDLFDANGWDVPRTLAELEMLFDRILADGRYAPLCLGVESAGATGWILTDYVEYLVLSQNGPDVYDEWVAGRVDTADPRILAQVERLDRWLHRDGMVYGTVEQVLARTVEGSFALLAQPEPPCLLNLNSDWVLGEISPQLDAGRVVLAPTTTGTPPGTPVIARFSFPGNTAGDPALIAGGDQLVALTDDPLVWDFLAAVSSEDWGIPWAEAGPFISPQAGFPPDAYQNDAARLTWTDLQRSPNVRFDGSDEMPARVGSGAMWSALVELLGGSPPATVAAQIDDAW